ncbi:MAG TPA: squalene/phytoene synthase family protein [Polyangiales bacterium]|nr:squalene/phytoene synthase family protein [Polyangiales bacterium]
MVRSSYDVVVVGAGPVGSVAAVAAARTGQRVLLLEANPEAANRFAGEWLHPTGVAVLDRLRIGRLEGGEARTGYGFVVFPDDGSEPIELPYPAGHVALACEHSRIVESIRERAIALPEVEYLPHARVTNIAGHDVSFKVKNREHTVRAGRIIGADGRASVARKALGLGNGQAISYMGSVELRGVELPVEGYGHVVLGGPGPVLLYRIGPDLIRGCFDVPLSFDASRRNPAFLWDGYAAVIPERLRGAFRDALERGPVGWAVNRFAPRALYGRDAITLAGDAVGHFHPLTAAGMTLGFLDAELAGSGVPLKEYQKQREKESYVPELLSNALYHVFAREDASAAAIRSATWKVWKQSRFERERTMRILMGAEPRRSSFGVVFSRIALSAFGSSIKELGQTRRLRDFGHTLVSYREWMQWPAANFVPSRGRKVYRMKSTSDRPLPMRVPGLRMVKVEPLSVPVVEVPVLASEKGTVSEALSLAGDALLVELRRLHERIGKAPDWALLRRATRIVSAIDAADLGTSMQARMRLAKRPMARVGISRLVAAYEAEPHVIRASDFANFVLSILTPDEGETIDRLEDGVRHLLACQRTSGGFAPWPTLHAGADYLTTELACRALARCRDRYGDDGALRYDEALRRASRFLLATQRKDGGWPASETEGALTNTVHAMRSLVATGALPSSPSLRRAARYLCAQQHADGTWHARTDERAGSPELTARSVLALLTVPGPHWGAIQRAVPHLVSLLSDTISEDVRGGGDSWDRCCDVVDALAGWEQRRRARPRAEGVKVEGDDWTFCKQSLVAVSRTFSKPIQMLPGDLEVAVTCGYLLCRIADTIEDHPAVPRGLKDGMFEMFLGTLEHRGEAQKLASAFEEIEGDDAELNAARNFPRVMRVFHKLPESMQVIVSRWTAEMARGMSLYTHREPGADGFVALYTTEDLERYCYYVAGTVGHMLTELFIDELGDKMDPETTSDLRHHAESFGAGLQLVNILKDVTDDRARRWSFIPRAACERVGLGIDNLVDPSVRDRAHDAVAPLLDLARVKLDRALEYALSLPADEKGVRLFCLLPLWMAALTLVHARGNDAMFVVGEEVKISRQAVEQVIADCMMNVGDDDYLRARYYELWEPVVIAERRA